MRVSVRAAESDGAASDTERTSSANSNKTQEFPSKSRAQPRSDVQQPSRPRRGHDGKKKKKKKAVEEEVKERPPRPVYINITNSRYPIFEDLIFELGYRETKRDTDVALWWCDELMNNDFLSKVTRNQRVNHFPGMHEIGRKDCLGRTLNRMEKRFPEHFNFYPRTWVLPNDIGDLRESYPALKKKGTTFIYKPDYGSKGAGINLLRNLDHILGSTDEDGVIQQYISRPFLINKLKFDMRVYVLVTCVDPLRVYVHNEGMARFCTDEYHPPTHSNMHNPFMHLTNYAINKNNDRFVHDDGDGSEEGASKWSLSRLRDYCESQGYRWGPMWEQVCRMVVKTLVSIAPNLSRAYRLHFTQDTDNFQCFDVLGFDVILDSNFNPQLLEVNMSPSFHTDSNLDHTVKMSVLRDVFQLLRIRPYDKTKHKLQKQKEMDERLRGITSTQQVKERQKEVKEEALKEFTAFEEENMGDFTRVYPADDEDLQATYESFIKAPNPLFGETKSSSVRREQVKDRMEEKRREDVRKREEDTATARRDAQAPKPRPRRRVNPKVDWLPAEDDKPGDDGDISKETLGGADPKKQADGGASPSLEDARARLQRNARAAQVQKAEQGAVQPSSDLWLIIGDQSRNFINGEIVKRRAAHSEMNYHQRHLEELSMQHRRVDEQAPVIPSPELVPDKEPPPAKKVMVSAEYTNWILSEVREKYRRERRQATVERQLGETAPHIHEKLVAASREVAREAVGQLHGPPYRPSPRMPSAAQDDSRYNLVNLPGGEHNGDRRAVSSHANERPSPPGSSTSGADSMVRPPFISYMTMRREKGAAPAPPESHSIWKTDVQNKNVLAGKLMSMAPPGVHIGGCRMTNKSLDSMVLSHGSPALSRPGPSGNSSSLPAFAKPGQGAGSPQKKTFTSWINMKMTRPGGSAPRAPSSTQKTFTVPGVSGTRFHGE